MSKKSSVKKSRKETRCQLAEFVQKAADEGSREGAMIPREKLYEIVDALMK